MDDTEWMTYAELAQKRGIKIASARKLAQKNRWHKQPNNDGTVRIAVPVNRLDVPIPSEGQSQTVSHKTPDPKVSILVAQIEGLKGIVESERKRADTAESNAAHWREQATKSFWQRLVG